MIHVAFVTGSRNFRTPGPLFDWLDARREEARVTAGTLVVMHGACPEGGDAWAHQWVLAQAKRSHQHPRIYEQADPALWVGKSRMGAGPVRNRRQAMRLLEYREEGGVVIKVAVCHWLDSLDDIARATSSGTGSQLRQLRNVGIPESWMTLIRDN